MLAATLGGFGQRLGRLALGADKQDTAVIGDDAAHGSQGLVQHGDGLAEVDDVNVVANAEDVRRHTGIPALGLVAEMYAGFDELAHIESR